MRWLIWFGMVGLLGPSLWSSLGAQPAGLAFSFYDSVQVLRMDGTALRMPLAGGIDTPQLSNIDLDGDGVPDLVAFDRTSRRLLCLLRRQNRWTAAPEYAARFPPLQYWVLLRDYDGDGRQDLWTRGDFGIRVFRHAATTGQPVHFVLQTDSLHTGSLANPALRFPINASPVDIPAIEDLDGDGDLDLLVSDALLGQSVELHRNWSVERRGQPGSLRDFDRVRTDGGRWANLWECSTGCFDYSLNGVTCRIRERTAHLGGKSLLTWDLNGDGINELLLGHGGCNALARLQNTGTSFTPRYVNLSTNFPENTPLDLPSFPSPFRADADGDGRADLLIAPAEIASGTNAARNILLFANSGTNAAPVFGARQEGFLQDDMLDLGRMAVPAVADVDGDGDLDVLAAAQTLRDGQATTALWYWENNGTLAQPRWQLRSQDQWSMAALRLLDVRIQWADLNGDGRQDLCWIGRPATTNEAALRYTLNTAVTGIAVDLSQAQTLPVAVSPGDRPWLADLDNDGDQDLLVAKNLGALEYWENTGALNFVRRRAAVGQLRDDFTFTRRQLAVALADLNGDGQQDLITHDQSGRLRLYPAFDPMADTLIAAQGWLYSQSEGRWIDGYDFGQSVMPVAFGRDLLLGTAAGGLLYLRRQGTVTGIDDQAIAAALDLFPNPAHHLLNLRHQGSLQAQVQVTDALGRIIHQTTLSPYTDQQWEVAQWPRGVYIIHIRTIHQKYSRRILLH